MSKIPIQYLVFIQNACDIDGNGKLEINAQKNGQTYDEVSIFNRACESYDEKKQTVIVNNEEKTIGELIRMFFEPKNPFIERTDAISTEAKERAKRGAEIQENIKTSRGTTTSSNINSGNPLYFSKQLTQKKWAKKWIEDNSKDKTVARNLEKFEPYFEKAAREHNVPKNVLKGICMKETTMGKSSSNVMQILGDSTYITLKMSRKDANNPEICIMKAAECLKMMLDKSDGNIARALVGYNTGENKPAFKNWSKVHAGGYADKVLSFALAFDELDKSNTNT